MRYLLKSLFLSALLGAVCFGQSALLTPWTNVQFLDNAGRPLSGGLVYSCQAGASCPGSPLQTFTSSNGLTANSNPIVLDGGGRAQIWLLPNTGYRFVVTTSTGAVISGAGGDNIFGSVTQLPTQLTPSGPQNAVQLNGGGNTLLGTANFVFNPTTQTLDVTGLTGQASIASLNGYIQSYGGFLSSVSNGGLWNGFNSNTDGAFLRGYYVAQTTANTAGGYLELGPITYNPYNGATCTDSFGNHVQQPLPLNGLASFGPNDALIWVGNSPSMPAGGACGGPLPIPTNLGVNTNAWLFARGGLITDNAAFNSITSLFGGSYVKLGYTTDQALYPKAYAASTSLNTPGAGYGGLAYQGGSIYYFFNSTTGTWNTVNLAASGGGSGCTLGATATGQILFNLSSVCTSSANLAWNNATQQMSIASTASNVAALTISTGYVASAAGFNSLACASANCVNVADGGVQVGLGILAGQLTTCTSGTCGAFYPMGYASTASLAVPPSGAGGLSYSGAGAVYYYYNSTTPGWASVNFATSGSGCTLGGTATGQIIFNLTGACTSSGNLTWNNATGQLGVVTSADSVAAITVGPGLVSATGGFNSLSCTASNCIQAPNGGMKAILGFTTDQALYPKGYASAGSLNTPPSNYGGIGYTGTGLNYWVWNATTSTWNSVTFGGGGGGGGVAGPVNSVQYQFPAGTQAGDSNFTWDPSGHVLNISGQISIIGVASINNSNQFVGTGGVNTAGTVQSQATGSAVGFQLANNNFSVLGTGAITTVSTVQANSFNSLACALSNCVQSSGGISSSASGTNVGFQLSNGNFSVNGNGTVQGTTFQAAGASGSFNVLTDTAFNSFQTPGGINLRTTGAAVNGITSNGQAILSSANVYIGPGVNIAASTTYAIAGTTVINSAGAFVGPGGIATTGNASLGNLTASSGVFSSGVVTGSAGSNSTLITGVSGNIYVRPVSAASTSLSCSGVADGWTAITSDSFVVYCRGGSRFRAALTSF